LALALALANCGKSSVDPKYGVSASPRVVDLGAPVPKGGGNYRVGQPYQVAGRTYVPEENTSYEAEGVASWYGDVFHGRLTANGEVFDMNSVSAAHPTLPLPSYVRVTNLRNNRSLIVRVNDRGPFHENRVIDVSVRAAKLLDFHRFGVTQARVEYVGRASLNGSDDEKLAATLRHGTPAPGPATMVASAKPKRGYRPEYFDPRPTVRTASAAAPQPATRAPPAQPAPAPRVAAAEPPPSFEARFAPAASAPPPGRAEPVSAFAPRFDSVLTGRGLY
jgi:rare lipoprotein A